MGGDNIRVINAFLEQDKPPDEVHTCKLESSHDEDKVKIVLGVHGCSIRTKVLDSFRQFLLEVKSEVPPTVLSRGRVERVGESDG